MIPVENTFDIGNSSLVDGKKWLPCTKDATNSGSIPSRSLQSGTQEQCTLKVYLHVSGCGHGIIYTLLPRLQHVPKP